MNTPRIITRDQIHAAIRYDYESGLWEGCRRNDDGELECQKFADRQEAVEFLGIRPETLQ
jgi:hypothetical protein